MAQVVRAAATAAHPGWHLTRQRFWLVQQPRGLHHQPLWDVTALVALSAMDSDRRALEAVCLRALEEPADDRPPSPAGGGAAVDEGTSSGGDSDGGA